MPNVVPKPDRGCRRHRQRGWILIETLFAMAFLVFATAMAVKIHQARQQYDRISLDRLRKQLLLENVSLPFQSMPYTQIAENATVGLDPQAGVEVDVNPFQSDGFNGLHLTFKLMSQGGPLTHHIWRWEPAK